MSALKVDSGRERETDRQTDRQTDKQRHRHTETQRDRDRDFLAPKGVIEPAKLLRQTFRSDALHTELSRP